MTITPDLARVYASAPSERRYVWTLELWHPLFPRRFYITNDGQPWQFLLTPTGPLVPFVPVPFAIVLPTRDGKGQQDMQIQIDNVGREAMDAIEAASFDPTTSITVTMRAYLDIAGSAPQDWPPKVLALQSVTVDAGAITGTATRADTLNRPFPSVVYRVDLFPGLNR